MKLTAKVDVRRLKLKMIRWMKTCREEEKASLQEFSRAFVADAMKFTPPGNGRMSVGKAHKALKERIAEDFLGYRENALWLNSKLGWYTSPGGRRHAYLYDEDTPYDKQGRVSPFFVWTKSNDSVLAMSQCLRARGGKYGLEFLRSLEGVVGNRKRRGAAGYYYAASFRGRKRTKPVRLMWYGVRHVTTIEALRKEVRRRQFLVGHLAAGWKPIALRSGAKLPAAVNKHAGHGSVTMRHDSRHGAVATAVNHSSDSRLQSIVDRNVPKLRKKFRATARRRAKQKFAPALRKA